MDLTKAITSRKSVKKFTSKIPDWRDIIECIDSARYSPMAGNNYSLKFIVVANQETKNKLGEAAQQLWIAKAPYIIIVCTNPLRTLNAYGERGKIYLRQQAGAAIQNLLLKAVDKKLGACWVGHFIEYLVKEAVKLPDNIEVEALIPIGFEHPNSTKPKKKIDLDNILLFEKWGQKKINPEKNFRV